MSTNELATKRSKDKRLRRALKQNDSIWTQSFNFLILGAYNGPHPLSWLIYLTLITTLLVGTPYFYKEENEAQKNVNNLPEVTEQTL